MLYELTHKIKKHAPWLWWLVEQFNECVFFVRYNKKLKDIPIILNRYCGKYLFKQVELKDVNELEAFFSAQPTETYEFFQPHAFDKKTLEILCKQKSFLMFLVKKEQIIIGYFFLRCYMNGTVFKGRMVDINARNLGIGKMMGYIMNDIVRTLGVRLFTSISPKNFSSLQSVKAVNNIKIIRILPNGYYYIECTPKP